MKMSTLQENGRVLIPKLWVAMDFFSRFLGLMGRSGLRADEAVFFPKCNSIHTFFMRFRIDVVFVDAEGKIIEIIEGLKAWRMLLPRSKAKHTIEFTASRTRELGLKTGMRLDWEEKIS